MGTATGNGRGAVLDLDVLGDFGVRHQLQPVPVAPAGQRLLAYLAVYRRPVLRTHAAASLWQHGTDSQACANLRSTLRRLPRPAGQPLVTVDPTHVALPPTVRVDLWEAQASMEPGEPDDADEAGSTDPALLQRDLLPEWDEDWLLAERERHRLLRLHALERLCARHREQGRFHLALRAGLAAVTSEPLRESAHRELIAVHLAEGNHAEALRQYDTYRRHLRLELGLSPSPAIRSVVAHLLGRPADARVAGTGAGNRDAVRAAGTRAAQGRRPW
jgi:DNA-binding SARP family transcriptional activator